MLHGASLVYMMSQCYKLTHSMTSNVTHISHAHLTACDGDAMTVVMALPHDQPNARHGTSSEMMYNKLQHVAGSHHGHTHCGMDDR